MVASNDSHQKARLLDLTTNMLKFVQDGNRDAGEVADVLQVINDHLDFSTRLRGGIYFINCDAAPVIPSGWKVKEKDQPPGRVCGQFAWDPAEVKLYLSENQQGGKVIEGNKLKEELANKPVLPANVLDFLLQNPHLIPEDWKKNKNGNTRCIFFWGTIYRDSYGNPCVRCLYFRDGRWAWPSSWLDYAWGGGGPAAVRAS